MCSSDLDHVSSVPEPAQPVALPERVTGRITVREAGFRYGNRAVIRNLDLEIAPGERIGLIGRVASGKSTLGRLLCGLYEPSGGTYRVDGLDSRQFGPHALRADLRFVGQDAELFSGTVRENLLFGAREASDADLIEAVMRSGAGSFIGRDATGFDYHVGERGGRAAGSAAGEREEHPAAFLVAVDEAAVGEDLDVARHARLALAEQMTTDHLMVSGAPQRRADLLSALKATEGVVQSWGRQYLAGRKTWQDLMNSVREEVQLRAQIADFDASQLVATWRIALMTGLILATGAARTP